MDDGKTAGFFPGIGDGVILPVDVLGAQIGNISLRTAQVPAKPVEVPALRVLLAHHDALMLIEGDGPLIFELNFRPEPFGNQWPWQPIHRETKVVEFSQMN